MQIMLEIMYKYLLLNFSLGQVYALTWHQLDNFEYHVALDVSTNYTGALAACESLNATLAKVDTTKAEIFLEDLVVSYKGFYIGLKRNRTSNTFRWLDGTELNVSQWKDGEPNDHGEKPEDCVQLGWKYFLEVSWNDIHCDYDGAGYICQKPKELPPTTDDSPTRLALEMMIETATKPVSNGSSTIRLSPEIPITTNKIDTSESATMMAARAMPTTICTEIPSTSPKSILRNFKAMIIPVGKTTRQNLEITATAIEEPINEDYKTQPATEAKATCQSRGIPKTILVPLLCGMFLICSLVAFGIYKVKKSKTEAFEVVA